MDGDKLQQNIVAAELKLHNGDSLQRCQQGEISLRILSCPHTKVPPDWAVEAVEQGRTASKAEKLTSFDCRNLRVEAAEDVERQPIRRLPAFLRRKTPGSEK